MFADVPVTVNLRARALFENPPETRVLDARHTHARTLWNHGWGRGRFGAFEQYAASIPVPTPSLDDPQFQYRVLVDRGLSLTSACRVVGLDFSGTDDVFSSYGDEPVTPEVYWLWVHSGRANRGRCGFEVRQGLAKFERGLTAFEGVCLFAQYPRLVSSHAIDLVASHIGSFPAYNACIMVCKGQPTLGVAEHCVGSPVRGAATCRW
jgi:hypothetical protein